MSRNLISLPSTIILGVVTSLLACSPAGSSIDDNGNTGAGGLAANQGGGTGVVGAGGGIQGYGGAGVTGGAQGYGGAGVGGNVVGAGGTISGVGGMGQGGKTLVGNGGAVVGQGGSVVGQGGSVVGQGGGVVVGQGGSVVGQGGAVVVGQGGAVVVGQGGAVTGSGGSTATAGDNILLLTTEPDYNWVTDDPSAAAVQGSVYAYSDGSSCEVTDGVSICTAQSNCCISGEVVKDSTYAKYGCGIGLELNSSGGDSPVKSAYAGGAIGFRVTIAGNFDGLEIRISYTHAAAMDGKEAPFFKITAAGTYDVLFTDAKCGAWTTEAKCVNTTTPYDLQIQMPGGSQAGAYSICLTEVTPLF